jgi:anti-sigma-K factor RskA
VVSAGSNQDANNETGAVERARLEQRSRDVLEDSVARLDGRTLSKLTQARHAALAARAKPQQTWWRGFVPAGAAAAVAVLAVALFVARPTSNPLPVATGNGAALDSELVADVEAIELIEAGDEFEFYEWAAFESGVDDAA